MSFFTKDKSFVNKIIFPAPKPPTYTANTFDRYRGDFSLFWVPRHHPGKRRAADSAHDPNSVPCLLYRNPKGSKRVLLYCHGNSEDIGNSPYTLQRLAMTLKCHAIAVEYPGYGISKGIPSETTLNNDILVVYSFLRGVLRWPTEDILLFGFSIGTGPTTQLASHEAVGGLTLVAPYTSIRDMVVQVMPKGVGKVAQYMISNRFINKKAIKTVKCPTLIIHGKGDKLIPWEHSQEIYDNCGSEKKQLYLSEEMDHCFDDEDLEAFILFPMLGFFNMKRGLRELKLPRYVLVKPNDPTGDPIDEKKQEEPTFVETMPGSPRSENPPEEERVVAVDWACARCTYVNSSDFDFCEVCEAEKPAVPVPVPGGDDDGDESPDHVVSQEEFDNMEALLNSGLNTLWSCSSCTFLNPTDYVKCVVCQTLKPTASMDDIRHPWQCTMCTFINAAARSNCELCSGPRPTNPDPADLPPKTPNPKDGDKDEDDDGSGSTKKSGSAARSGSSPDLVV